MIRVSNRYIHTIAGQQLNRAVCESLRIPEAFGLDIAATAQSSTSGFQETESVRGGDVEGQKVTGVKQHLL